MPTSKNLNNFVINKVESQAVFDEMKRRGMIEADETYWVLGGQELPEVTTSDNGKVATVTNGSWSAENLPTASASTAGVIKVGSGLSITNGVLSATGGGTADAVEWSNVLNTPTTLSGYGITDAQSKITSTNKLPVNNVSGLATVATTGSYNDLSNKPTPYSLPIASSSALGGVKVGSGLSIDGNGVLSSTGGSSNVLFTLTGTTVTSTKTPSELATNFKAGSGVSAILNTTSTGDYESLYKITCNNTTITFATITGNTLGGGFIYKRVVGNISTGIWAYEDTIEQLPTLQGGSY